MKYAKQIPLQSYKVSGHFSVFRVSVSCVTGLLTWTATQDLRQAWSCNHWESCLCKYVYSNSKLVASTRDPDKLKMFAWDNEELRFCTACLLRQQGSGQARGARAQRAQVVAPLIGAPRPTLSTNLPFKTSNYFLESESQYNQFLNQANLIQKSNVAVASRQYFSLNIFRVSAA